MTIGDLYMLREQLRAIYLDGGPIWPRTARETYLQLGAALLAEHARGALTPEQARILDGIVCAELLAVGDA